MGALARRRRLGALRNVGYRHLAYAQTQIGYDVKPDMPGLTGPQVAYLYERGARWLAGDDHGDPVVTTPPQ
jgi:hypothetical protein